MCVCATLGSNGFAFVEFYETQDAVRWMEDNKVSTYMQLLTVHGS